MAFVNQLDEKETLSLPDRLWPPLAVDAQRDSILLWPA
jgi:hypothetical protein